MQFLLDNLLAVIVGGVVVLLMAALSLHNVEAQSDARRYHAMRANTNSFIETLRADLTNLGAGVPAARPRLYQPQTLGGTSNTGQFRFHTQVGGAGGAVRAHVQYRLVATGGGCKRTEAQTVPCYDLVREQCDSTFATASCQSAGTLPAVTAFQIGLVTASGGVAPTPADARGVQVQFAARSPLGPNRIVPETRFETTFHPLNLARP